jgi:hypothetical protein
MTKRTCHTFVIGIRNAELQAQGWPRRNGGRPRYRFRRNPRPSSDAAIDVSAAARSQNPPTSTAGGAEGGVAAATSAGAVAEVGAAAAAGGAETT